MNISRIKATLTLLFLTLFLSQSVIFAQTGKKITINRDRITIKEALVSVEKQTEMSVAYNESALGAGKVISLNLNDESLEKTLDAILKGTGFTWAIENDYIIISPVKKAAESKTVSGTVIDETGLPMIGVGVIVQGGQALSPIWTESILSPPKRGTSLNFPISDMCPSPFLFQPRHSMT